uniref:Uncharacterized protein n=1 Tax=Solanum lycopersicum TaxID=4081 RepID=A0A3Q7I4J1_SOLLC
MVPIMGHTMKYRRMIIMLQSGYFIPPLRKKRAYIKKHNIMAIHLCNTFLPQEHARNYRQSTEIQSTKKFDLWIESLW